MIVCVILFAGCASDPLRFPEKPAMMSDAEVAYNVRTAANGRPDFALLPDNRPNADPHKLNLIAYDDNGDGKWDRLYRLSDYSNEEVPHLIILLDSIPFSAVQERWDRGEFRFFDPPQKLIGPFPSLSEQIFTRILHAPPLPGMTDDYFDKQQNAVRKGILKRVGGYHQPWEFRNNYTAKYWEGGLSYIDPRDWFHIELKRAKKALDESPDRVTVVYFVSASAMVCRYGRQGLNEVLDAVQRLCLQLLYERQGALKISMTADHGHNLMSSTNIDLEPTLKAAGLHPATSLKQPSDVVLEYDGLVTYFGLHTHQPVAAAEAILNRPEIELVTYQAGDRVVVRDSNGIAAIERRGNRFRYTAQAGDPLRYCEIVERLRDKAEEDGFIDDADWFAATLDVEFPDGPRRLWEAFHGLSINPPDVMITVRDGYCCGKPWLEKFIHMASTHGGLNQVNTATFLMSMTGRVTKPLRSGQVLQTVEPGYALPVREKK
jgi:hypothetical protein